MPRTRLTIAEAKRSLGQQLRTMKGFVGIGIGDGDILLYVVDSTAPVVKHFRANFGDSYIGYLVSLVLLPGFPAHGTPRRQRSTYGVGFVARRGVEFLLSGVFAGFT